MDPEGQSGSGGAFGNTLLQWAKQLNEVRSNLLPAVAEEDQVPEGLTAEQAKMFREQRQRFLAKKQADDEEAARRVAKPGGDAGGGWWGGLGSKLQKLQTSMGGIEAQSLQHLGDTPHAPVVGEGARGNASDASLSAGPHPPALAAGQVLPPCPDDGGSGGPPEKGATQGDWGTWLDRKMEGILAANRCGLRCGCLRANCLCVRACVRESVILGASIGAVRLLNGLVAVHRTEALERAKTIAGEKVGEVGSVLTQNLDNLGVKLGGDAASGSVLGVSVDVQRLKTIGQGWLVLCSWHFIPAGPCMRSCMLC